MNFDLLKAAWGDSAPRPRITLIPDGVHKAQVVSSNFDEEHATVWFRYSFPAYNGQEISVPVNLMNRDGEASLPGLASLRGTLAALGQELPEQEPDSPQVIHDACAAVVGSVAMVRLVTNQRTYTDMNGAQQTKRYTKIFVNELLGIEDVAPRAEAAPF